MIVQSDGYALRVARRRSASSTSACAGSCARGNRRTGPARPSMRAFLFTAQRGVNRPDARHVRSLLVQPYAVRTRMIDGAALLGEGGAPCHRRFAWLGLLLPPLRPEAVARRVVRAVVEGEERVYIPSIVGWAPTILNLLPAAARDALLSVCGAADGMHGFRGCAPPPRS